MSESCYQESYKDKIFKNWGPFPQNLPYWLSTFNYRKAYNAYTKFERDYFRRLENNLHVVETLSSQSQELTYMLFDSYVDNIFAFVTCEPTFDGLLEFLELETFRKPEVGAHVLSHFLDEMNSLYHDKFDKFKSTESEKITCQIQYFERYSAVLKILAQRIAVACFEEKLPRDYFQFAQVVQQLEINKASISI